jgi:hypothetical protein
MKRVKSARGWGIPEQIKIDRENYDVNLCGVCTCSRHKECAGQKRCLDIFDRSGGTVQKMATLRRLMGKSYPRRFGNGWERGYNHKRAQRIDAATEEFEKKFFKR